MKISKSRMDVEAGRIDNAILKDYSETMVGGANGTNTTATYTVDISTGSTFNLILSANCTFTFSNPTASATGCSFTLILKQDSTGSRTVTWPVSVKWPGNRAPVIPPTAGHSTIVSFFTPDAGTTYLGFPTGAAYQPVPNLWGWGLNTSGQVGDNTVTARSSPVQVGTLATWSSVTAGQYHSLAIKTDNTLWAWGLGTSGQIGDNTATTRSSPVQVGTLATWSSARAGGAVHSLAVKTDNTLWAWGEGSTGELGDNTATDRSSPVQIGTLATWSAVAGGLTHSLAIKTDNTLWAWGLGNNGRLGDNTATTRSSPVQVGTLATWSSVAAGQYHSLAIKTDNTLWAWGLNTSGRVGDNTTTTRSSPVQIGGSQGWTSISAGYHSEAILTTT